MSNNSKKALFITFFIILIILSISVLLYSKASKDTSLGSQGLIETNNDNEGINSTVVEDNVFQISTQITDYRNLLLRKAVTTKIIDNLDAPWAFRWLPSGDILVTERFGNLKIIQDGTVNTENITGVPEVFSGGQGGLLDVTIHPNFEENSYIYLSYSHGNEEGNRLRVLRTKLSGRNLEDAEIIFEVAQTKTGTSHYGSRFQWLPDGTLTFSVGDGGNPPINYNGSLIREQAQSLNAHLGKIIRINDDGTIPKNNPFNGRSDVSHLLNI